MASFLGFKIQKKSSDVQNEKHYIEQEIDDGSLSIQAGGIYGHYYDVTQGADSSTNDAQLINRYRQIANDSDVEIAIEEIISEAIVYDQSNNIVDLNLDNLDLSDKIKNVIEEEFKNILSLLNFRANAWDLFRQWYVDGRLYFEKKINEKNPKKGLTSLTLIDPRKIKKVRERVMEKDSQGREKIKLEKEYFLYNPEGSVEADNKQKMLAIAADAITYVTSGLKSIDNKLVLSHLHKALKPFNQLKMLEDSVVIYRITRAPERRVFYVDVGNLPKMKAEQYLRQLMNQYKTKLVYDTSTGEMKDQKRHMSMTEDFWMARRDGGRGTEVQSLPSGQNLGEMEDVAYFKQKLYRALNVPVSRIEPDTPFGSRVSEINREEIKFNKYINRLRARFSHLFDDLLKTQLVLKGVISIEDWKIIQNDISYRFVEDSMFSEAKKIEIYRERFSMLRDATEYMGTFVSKEWVMKTILNMDDNDIQEMTKQIEKEKESGEYDNEEENSRF